MSSKKLFSQALQKFKEKERLLALAAAASGANSEASESVSGKKLLPEKTVQLVFLSAVRVEFTVPVTDRRIPLKRDYICCLFNKGTLVIAATCISAELKPLLIPGASFLTKFIHTDAARMSYDTVRINLGPKQLQVDKPKTAETALKKILESKDFFLQESALSRISDFFSLQFQGMNLVSIAQVVVGFKDLTQFAQLVPSDCDLLLRKAAADEDDVQIIAAPVQPSRPSLSTSKTVHRPGGTALEQKSLRTRCQYDPLKNDQLIIVLGCDSCLAIFSFASEKINHFLLMPDCFSSLKAQHRGQIQDAVDKAIEEKVCLDHQKQRLECCGQLFESVLGYCIHRDSHGRDDSAFTCFECGAMLWSPYSLYRHKCTIDYLIAPQKNCYSRQDVVVSPRSNYPSLDASEAQSLLTCFCGKALPFVNFLVSHCIASIPCFHLLASLLNGPQKNFAKAWLLNRKQPAREITCSECGLVLSNQVLYMLHQDHHSTVETNVVCKGCSYQFPTPCQFFRHICETMKDLNDVRQLTCIICEKIAVCMSSRRDNESDTLGLQIESVHQALDWSHDIIDEMDIKDEPVEGVFVSTYNRERSLWKINGAPKPYPADWYVCTDCEPYRILTEDSIGAHMKDCENHYRVDPAWLYSKSELLIKDLRLQPKYKSLVERLQK